MLLLVLYILAIVAESITGALAAGKYKMDLFGVMLISLVTAIGGGTIRDILLNMYPLTWVEHPNYIILLCSASIITTIIPSTILRFDKAFLILDAIGLIAFSIIGVNKALEYGHGFLICVVSGMVTGVFGGVLRDILCNRIPLVFQREIYAGVSIASCVIYYVLHTYTHISNNSVIFITLVLGFLMRIVAIYYKLSLPIFVYDKNKHIANSIVKRKEKKETNETKQDHR